MSLIKGILNPYLRLTEKPFLARGTPEELRRGLERKARLFFWPPRGARFSETDNGAVAVNMDRFSARPILLYFHGGGYVFGSPETHRAMVARLSQMTNLPAMLPRYRLAPENMFPAAFDDALAAYERTMAHPGGVILGGDSAGGGLALAILAEIMRRKLPRPLGCFCFSPLTDMTFSGESIRTNAKADVELPAGRIHEMADIYLGKSDPTDPRASPLFADFTNAPPIWLCVGDTEILRDDTLRLAKLLQTRGVTFEMHQECDLPHVWPIFHNLLPEARTTLRDLSRWIRDLPRPSFDN